jgi:glycosyltransferase 2 family protein
LASASAASAPAPEDVRVKTLLRLAGAIAGLGLFAWFVRHAGPTAIIREFVELGASAPLLLLPYSLVYLFDTLGWTTTFVAGAADRAGFGTLFRIRTAGEAVNNLLPSAYLGGEPVKVYLAARYGIPTASAAQSVVVAKTTMTLAELLFIMIGAVAALHTLPAGSSAYRGMLALTGLAASIVALLFWLQRRGIFGAFLRGSRRLGWHIGVLERHQRELENLDALIIAFYRDERARFFASTALHLAGWTAGFFEVWLGAYLLGTPIHWTQALAIEAFAAVAKGIGAFVPGSIGVQESSVVLLFRVFALPEPLGISYAIIRRGRELLWVALGVVFLLREESSFEGLTAWLRTGAGR